MLRIAVGTIAGSSSTGVDVSTNAAEISRAQSTATTAGDSVSENLSNAQSAAGPVSDANAAGALSAAQVSLESAFISAQLLRKAPKLRFRLNEIFFLACVWPRLTGAALQTAKSS